MYAVERAPQELLFGRQGESNILSYEFDYSAWVEEWPGGLASVTVILPNQTQPQPIPDTQAVVDGTIITLHVLDNLTEKDGRGTLIIRYVAGTNKKRSRLIEFVVEKGHETQVGSGLAVVEDWVDEATKTLNDVKSLEFTINEDGELLAGETILGRVSDNPRGDYNPSADPLYSKRDVVFDNGGSFVYINDTPSNEPTSSASHWQQIAEKGDIGDEGIQGIHRTSGDGSPGSIDTYTVTYNDGNKEFTFTVYNGADAPALSGVKRYIIRWDKVNSQCTRMGDAAAITTTITNFCHRGEVNASYDNPFDNLYPWKYRKLCKVDRAAYALLAPGSPITDAVTMWEGEPGFALDGTGDFDGVYTPEFWGRVWQDATYVYAGVADGPIPGWQYFEATIGGRYFGAMDGSSKITSIAASLPLRNTQMSAMHTNVTAQGMTLDDVWTWSGDTLLMAVEYATLNSEIAIGKGVDGLSRASSEKVGANASIGATVLKLPNAFVSACVSGALIGLGTSDGGEQTGTTRFVSSADLDGADPLFATHKAVTVPALTVNITTDTFVCIHGAYNAPDAAIGSMSGYIGTNGKSNAYYRGRVSHGNFFRYCLGAYRQTGTGKIWVANNRTEAAAADALNTGVHRDTGLALLTASNYIAELHFDNLLPMAPFAKTTGGTAGSTNPVGDYCYVPSLETGNTILRLGGLAGYGAGGGRFCGDWLLTASDSLWHASCLPFLKTP